MSVRIMIEESHRVEKKQIRIKKENVKRQTKDDFQKCRVCSVCERIY